MTGYVGENSIRSDGRDKITGRALYAGDIFMDGMLHAALVRSERVHAEILSVDTAKLPSDAVVIKAEDLSSNIVPDIVNDRPVLAAGKVRYYGEPIAVVACSSRKQAYDAASEVKVSYRDIKKVLSSDDALKEGAVKVHESGNLVSEFENTKGDPDKAFSECALVIEHDFETPNQEHAYMEPDACFSYMDGDVLTVISSSQNVFMDKRMIMSVLGIPEDRVHVVSATVGGAFGGKDGNTTQLFCAAVTYRTGKPCRMVFDRRESIACTFKRHSTRSHVKIGFAPDGRILAFDSFSLIDTGAYIGYGLTVLGLLCEHAPGPYSIDNIHVKGKLYYTNKTPSSAFRGFGVPQITFATESVISEAACALGIDPVDIRIKNALETGDTGSLGQKITTGCGIRQALEMFKQTDFWKNRSKDKGCGCGVAAGFLSCGFGKNIPDNATAIIKEKEDGKKEVRIGFNDIGQGSIASLSAIAADALKTDIAEIEMVMADTDRTGDCGSTAASRSTFIAGKAITDAAREFNKRKAAGEKNICVCSTVPFPEANENTATGLPHHIFSFVVQGVKVKVDSPTGMATVTDAVSVAEAGKIVNPMQFAGQMCGGMVQSIGFSLYENCSPDSSGIIRSDSFSTYIIPTMADAPHFESFTVDSYEPSGPFGAKGAAEAPTVPTAAAVNAALHDATGIWHYSLPMFPESNIREDR